MWERLVFGLVVMIVLSSCGEEGDPLAPSIVLSGKVTNNSGVSGPVVVEIDYNMRDIADARGRYAIAVHRDLLIDSLYAWVDKDGNGDHTSGEPSGFYKQSPGRARPIHVRSTNVHSIDFSIP